MYWHIEISGFGGSGKSTLASRLTLEINAQSQQLIPFIIQMILLNINYGIFSILTGWRKNDVQ